MADIKGKPSDGGNKKMLMIGLVCLLLGIAGTAYEILRPRSADELKEEKENQKIQAEIERSNKKRSAAP